MKKIFILIFFVVYLITSFNLFSQCSTIHATALPTTAQNAGTSFTSRAGRYFILNVIADNTYEIKSNLATQNFCIRTGTYNGSIVAQGGMNNTSNGLVFMSSITGQVFIHVYTQACGTATTTDRTITVTNITSTFGVVNSLPYTQGFNSTLMPNNNWYGYALNMGSSGTPLRFTGLSSGSNPTSLPYESTHYIRANTYSAASGTTGRFISPPISTVGVANVSLTFYWGEDNSFSANDNVQVQYSTNGNTWINVGTPYSRYSPTALSTTTWSEKSIDLPSGAGNQSKIYIGFLFTSAWGGHMSLDKVTLSQTCTTPTNGGTISSNKSLTTVNDIISLTTSGNEGSLTKVEWSYNNFTTVAGSTTTPPSNPYNIRINGQQTQVWFRSTSKNGSCPEGNSNIISVNFRNAPVYSTGIDDGDYISNVTLNNINNTSTNDGDAYQDFTSQVIELTKGEPYQLSVTATNTFQSGQGYAAWIDYNGDGIFQTTENVLQKAPANSTSELITVPSDAATGDFLMRVLSAWGTTPSNDAYYSTGYGYGEIEEYTVRLSNPVALPVELIYFDGYEYPSFNSLKWSTASEHNSDYFKIERSTDGQNWEYIGTRLASGNSNTTINYSYLDSFKEFKIHYYRLIQMDYDGQYKIYGPISLDNTKTFKKVVKYVNLTGQEVDRQTKGVLFEVYEDGTTKKIINY